MKDELDKIEETVDKVLSPERAMRWMVRIVVLVIILGVCFVLGRVAMHMLGKVDTAVQEVEKQDQEEAAAAEAASLDYNWFVLKKDAIDAATIEVRKRMEALAGHNTVAANRGMLAFKGKEDRREAVRLQGRIAEAQSARLTLIRNYNETAARVTPAVLGELPKHIEVAELLAPAKPESE